MNNVWDWIFPHLFYFLCVSFSISFPNECILCVSCYHPTTTTNPQPHYKHRMLLYQCYGRFSSNCRENVESIAVNCWVTCFSIGTKECQECSIRAVSQRGMMKKRNRWNNEEKKETQTCIYDSYIHSHHKRGNKRIMGVGKFASSSCCTRLISLWVFRKWY